MDAQLTQAMGAMTLAERQRKHYASKTDEEKKAFNRKKTEAALERRRRKREEEAQYEAALKKVEAEREAAKGAGAGETPAVTPATLKKVEAEREAAKGAGAGETPAVTPATPNGLLEVEFNGKAFRIDPATRHIYTASGAKLGTPETHAPPVYVQAVVAPPPPPPKPKAKPKPKVKDEFVPLHPDPPAPSGDWEENFKSAKEKGQVGDTLPHSVPKTSYNPTAFHGTAWRRATGDTIDEWERKQVPRASDGKMVVDLVPVKKTYRGDADYDRGFARSLHYGFASEWTDTTGEPPARTERATLYSQGMEDGYKLRVILGDRPIPKQFALPKPSGIERRKVGEARTL